MMKTLPVVAAFFAASTLIVPTVSHASDVSPRVACAAPAADLARA